MIDWTNKKERKEYMKKWKPLLVGVLFIIPHKQFHI